jgi:hypothetical protein
MWRDPLDELVERLDEVSPPVREDSWQIVFLAMQRYTDVVLYGTEEDKARLDTDPYVQPFLAWANRFGRDGERGAEEAKGGDSPPKSSEEPSAGTANERSSGAMAIPTGSELTTADAASSEDEESAG